MSRELEDQVAEEQKSASEALESLEQDIVQGRPDAVEEDDSDLPEKFRGKSKADIAKSYQELESFNGRRNNEYSELKRVTDELLEMKKTAKAEEVPVDVDSLLDNPSKAINSAIDKNERLANIERQLIQQDLAKAKSGFEGKHPNWNETINTGDFQNWVNASPVRQKMFEAADKRYNYEVADELFTLYDDIRQVKATENKQNRDNRIKGNLNAAATESGVGSGKKEKRYRRADLINLQVYQPEKYEAMQVEIRKAYEDKRVD
jgi:hypothetical protein